MNIGNFPMSHGNNILHQLRDPFCIIRYHRSRIAENVVDRHHRQTAADKLDHLRFAEIHAGHHHTVHTTVTAMLHIRHVFLSQSLADESDIISQSLRFGFQALQYSREKRMGQGTVFIIHTEDADVIAPVCLQRSGCQIRKISHLLCLLLHQLFRLLTDVRKIIQSFAYRCGRYPKFSGYIL